MNPEIVRALLSLLTWGSLLAVMVAVAVRLIKRIRRGSENQEATTSQMLSKFCELHSRGELSDAEFRTIKTALATRSKRELKDNGERG